MTSEASTGGADPREILAREPMGRLQVIAVTMGILLLAVDGFDVLSISFAAPGIAEEWGINRAALGVVLSMELLGMGVGSLLIGNAADRFGRRPLILFCIVVMTAGMAMAAIAGSIETLSVFRFITGLGIGGMLASVNAIVAEYSNDRHRSLAVSLMAGGYPLGAIVGGLIVTVLLSWFDWRSVFVFGALLTASFFPLVWYLLPESVSYLLERQPPGALERINATLRRMDHRQISRLPALRNRETRSGFTRLFRPDMIRITLLLSLAFFAHIMTFYFFVKWIPKLVVDMGFAAPVAGSVLVWFNVGGLLGSVTLGLLTSRFVLRGLVIATLLLASAAVALFGQGQADLVQMSVIAAIGGFFTNAAIVGMYALFAQSFPTGVRASGTGFALGLGRGGAALGPVVAGLLFVAGYGLAVVSLLMALGSVVAAAALLLLSGAAPRSEDSGMGPDTRD